MIYLIDHQDSFTFNLAHLLGHFDDVFVTNYFNLNKTKLHHARTIVLSPGPGHPLDYPKTLEVYRKFKAKKKHQQVEGEGGRGGASRRQGEQAGGREQADGKEKAGEQADRRRADRERAP